jgi:hypothetical protein
MATGAVMPVKMKANTVPVVMAASCTREGGCPAGLSSNIGRSAATARQAMGPSRRHHGERAARWPRPRPPGLPDLGAAGPAEPAVTLVVYVLCGRNILATEDVAQMIARAAEIEEHELCVLHERK